jgi:hypothetical protein
MKLNWRLVGKWAENEPTEETVLEEKEEEKTKAPGRFPGRLVPVRVAVYNKNSGQANKTPQVLVPTY